MYTYIYVYAYVYVYTLTAFEAASGSQEYATWCAPGAPGTVAGRAPSSLTFW